MSKLIKKYYDGMQVHDILCECLDDYDTILTILEKFAETPTIDAVSVVHGEWIEVDDVSISCRCSVCGWEAHLYEDDVYGMPYCPNCGCRMKGADDD